MFDSYRENTLVYYPERCINCRRCSQVCPHGVFAEGEETAVLVHKTRCMECGACALNCPVQAIEVQSGVGCAWAMISAAIRGRDMDDCTCGGDTGSCCAENAETSSYCSENHEASSCCSGNTDSSSCSGYGAKVSSGCSGTGDTVSCCGKK